MGGCRRALKIIVDDLGDIAQAIAFVQEHSTGGDDELWDQLIARGRGSHSSTFHVKLSRYCP
jgi:hypothetical protein